MFSQTAHIRASHLSKFIITEYFWRGDDQSLETEAVSHIMKVLFQSDLGSSRLIVIQASDRSGALECSSEYKTHLHSLIFKAFSDIYMFFKKNDS